LYGLTERQARRLKEARDAQGGAYCGLTSGPENSELVDGGAAEYRAETKTEQRAAWAGHWEAGEYERTEYFLVPTAYGLELLAESEKRANEERERKEREWRKRYP
jgi:hypothetical protein